MRKLKTPKGYVALQQAIELLGADLIWSEDFEVIRVQLRMWLQDESKRGANRYAIAIAEALVAIDDDISIR